MQERAARLYKGAAHSAWFPRRAASMRSTLTSTEPFFIERRVLNAIQTRGRCACATLNGRQCKPDTDSSGRDDVERGSVGENPRHPGLATNDDAAKSRSSTESVRPSTADGLLTRSGPRYFSRHGQVLVLACDYVEYLSQLIINQEYLYLQLHTCQIYHITHIGVLGFNKDAGKSRKAV